MVTVAQVGKMDPNRWLVAGAKAKGTSHEKSGKPCQDAYECRTIEGGGVAIAVADGAGSAERSDEGAVAAVRAALEYIEREVATVRDEESAWKDLLIGAARGALEAVNARASELGVPARELASTLLLTVTLPRRTSALQIGDGAIVEDAPDGPRAFFKPAVGEYINETVFLVSTGAVETAQFATRVGAPVAIAAFSDGLEMLALKMPEGKPHPGFFKPLFELARTAMSERHVEEQIASLLDSPRVREKTDDDLTLVLVAPQSVASQSAKSLDISTDRKEPRSPSSSGVPSGASILSKKAPFPPSSSGMISGASVLSKNATPATRRNRIEAAAFSTANAIPRATKFSVAHSDKPRRVDGYVRGGVIGAVVGTLLGCLIGALGMRLLPREQISSSATIKPADAMSSQATAPPPRATSPPSAQNETPRETRPVGAPCLPTEVCAGGLRCIRGMCRALARVGEQCDEVRDCPGGYDCIGRVCALPPKKGDKKGVKRPGVLMSKCASADECPADLLCVHKRCYLGLGGLGSGCSAKTDCGGGLGCREFEIILESGAIRESICAPELQ